jgi:hypothetical protein
MGTTEDRDDPALRNIGPDGMQEKYLVLSEEDRAKGWVRPFRDSYIHVGIRPQYLTRPLNVEEQDRYSGVGYVAYEEYPEGGTAKGRFWTKAQLESGCGGTTVMGFAIAETYAANPTYYGGTYCATCRGHFPVGERGEFIWLDGTKVGT